MNKLTPTIRLFNDRVKIMNQTNSKQLLLTATEARSLHAELFNLLSLTIEDQPTPPSQVKVGLDGGGFK